MHACILNGLTLFSFHTFGNIHASQCIVRFEMGLACISFTLLKLFMSLNACLDIKWD